MTFDKNIFKRFNVKISQKKAQEQFINKINNVLYYSSGFSGQHFSLEFNSNIIFRFCQNYGLEYTGPHSFKNYLGTDSFTEKILRLNCLIHVLFSINKEKGVLLADIIEEYLKESPVDLNLRIIKTHEPYMIIPKGSKLLDTKLVDDSLAILTDSEFEPIRVAFEKGLKEFLQSTTEKPRLKNAVRDMQLSMDEVAKIILKDKNAGIKHLLKNENWPKINLNDYFQRIYFQHNEMIDKLAKHNAKYTFSSEETESIIYLTGLFIRLTLGKI